MANDKPLHVLNALREDAKVGVFLSAGLSEVSGYKRLPRSKEEKDKLVDIICLMLLDGMPYKQIAKELNYELAIMHRLLNKEEYHIKAKQALIMSANTFADKSITVLEECENDKLAIMKARELSQAYRWLAAKRASHIYGERIDVTSGGEKIVQLSLGSGVNPDEDKTIDITHKDE